MFLFRNVNKDDLLGFIYCMAKQSNSGNNRKKSMKKNLGHFISLLAGQWIDSLINLMLNFGKI